MTQSAVANTARPVIATVPPRQRGFSLLELLVALIVVVLVTTLVNFTVSSGGQDVRLESQVRGLADVASYALDEAAMTGMDYGLLLEQENREVQLSYNIRWLERALDGWRDPVGGQEVFALQRLPPGIELELELDDAPLVELTVDETDDEENLILPQVVIYASGETTPGALNVREASTGDLLWRVEWDLLGRFDVLLRGEVTDEEEDY